MKLNKTMNFYGVILQFTFKSKTCRQASITCINLYPAS
ncbi:hypothetical protein LHGZ1_2226 [Laribacter hongkongensis]|uniref:Uncharacterized protein n=1 Tax=Laribacter hongkongensis TaxID=168471 RepID=A0A248LJX5_9NEIS|nr:hypothetical protein LHGZ1_2226 [Laribacter hongkongensis]